jgi:hypothetical protein
MGSVILCDVAGEEKLSARPNWDWLSLEHQLLCHECTTSGYIEPVMGRWWVAQIHDCLQGR